MRRHDTIQNTTLVREWPLVHGGPDSACARFHCHKGSFIAPFTGSNLKAELPQLAHDSDIVWCPIIASTQSSARPTPSAIISHNDDPSPPGPASHQSGAGSIGDCLPKPATHSCDLIIPYTPRLLGFSHNQPALDLCGLGSCTLDTPILVFPWSLNSSRLIAADWDERTKLIHHFTYDFFVFIIIFFGVSAILLPTRFAPPTPPSAWPVPASPKYDLYTSR